VAGQHRGHDIAVASGCQTPVSTAMRTAGGLPAITALLIAPAEVPMTRAGSTPRS
jgi:hypothetical protein